VDLAVHAARLFKWEAAYKFLHLLVGLPMDSFGHAQTQPSPLLPFHQSFINIVSDSSVYGILALTYHPTDQESKGAATSAMH
jgi:hypothetical protein